MTCVCEFVRGVAYSSLPYRDAKRAVLSEFHQRYLAALLAKTGGNYAAASRLADMHRVNFRRVFGRVP